MFTNKNQTEQTAPGNSKTSLIGEGMVISGEIKTVADIRIDGRLHGNIDSSAKVVIGTGGIVEGNISALQCDITGTIRGNLQIKELLTLRENADIKGDVTAGKLSMEPSVSFNGKCIMGAASSQIVAMNQEKNERKAAAE
jgi:cytoskeletal protein CcmA (bactofilin family)